MISVHSFFTQRKTNATHVSRVNSLKTIFAPANDRDIRFYGSYNTHNKLFDVARPFLYSRKRSSEALRSHLASRYYISIYRSIYRRVIEVRAAPMRCNIDDTLAARGIAATQDEGNAQRGTGREKEKGTRGRESEIDGEMWTTSCRKGQLRIQRIDRIALPRSYGSSHCRDAGAKRERKREIKSEREKGERGIPYLSSRSSFPLDYIFHRHDRWKKQWKEKKRKKGEPEGERRGMSRSVGDTAAAK